MPDISATDAARNFSDLLDAVEHRGEHFTVLRRGKVIARLEPATPRGGRDLKAAMRRHLADETWGDELAEVRDLLEIEERS